MRSEIAKRILNEAEAARAEMKVGDTVVLDKGYANSSLVMIVRKGKHYSTVTDGEGEWETMTYRLSKHTPVTMKSFLKSFLAQTGIKALLIGLAIVVPVWTYFWSRQDGRFNITIILVGVGFILFVMLCELIDTKIKKWRTGKKQ